MSYLRRENFISSVLASVLMLLVYLYAIAAFEINPDFYYLSIQEDEYIEWATFLAFLFAVGVFSRLSYGRGSFIDYWFSAGLALFCFIVAMEEISWGQRVFGFRPPEYFLENNFQQEFNFHNVMATQLRKSALLMVIFGYGVILPLLTLVQRARRLLDRLHVSTPSLALTPAFVAAAWLQISYPMKFAGEWVELMVGLGFLFAGLLQLQNLSVKSTSAYRGVLTVFAAWIIVLAGGYGLAAMLRDSRGADQRLQVSARQELDALRDDFRSGRITTGCGKHKRLYTYVSEYREFYLLQGLFAQLTTQGLPKERAEFLLDPWNSPYWIRDNCPAGDITYRTTYLYSFGPNRRRDSTKWEVKGDDIAIYSRGRANAPRQ